MGTVSVGDSPFRARVRESSNQLLWLGIAMILVGVVAIALPIASTIAVSLVVGAVWLLFGAAMLAGSFSMHGAGPFFGALLMSFLAIVTGAFLLFNPLAGAVALTLVIGVLFVFQGAYEIALALEIRPLPGWEGMLFSGIASGLLALLIAIGWPETSTMVLGLLLGVNFITTGAAYVFLSRVLGSKT